MTNLEWVRTLSAEELAKLLSDDCDMCSKSNGGCNMDCKNGYIKWFNAEHVPEVKPCPFCGGKAHIEEVEQHTHSDFLKKFMSDKGMELPDCEGEAFIFCDACSASISGKNIEDVCQRWNRRANDGGVG